jgi:hypothetical protein
MFPMRKNHEFVRVIALLVACTFPNACTAGHMTSLEPQRFSPEKSPEHVRLTLSDGTRFTAKHPVGWGTASSGRLGRARLHAIQHRAQSLPAIFGRSKCTEPTRHGRSSC